MQELTIDEIDDINGGIIPVLVAIAMTEVSPAVAGFCIGVGAATGALLGYYANKS